MNSFAIFVSFLLLLFILSKAISQSLGTLIFACTKSKKITVGFLAVIFLPGTIIHEFAHGAIAQGLGVHVGEIEFTPKFEGHQIKLGSVQVADSDPFRRFLIGIAPLIVGFVLIFLTLALYDKFEIRGLWPQILLFYLLFQIGNTMFSSERDMEGALELLVAIGLVLGFVYLIGLKQIFEVIPSLIVKLEPVFKMATNSLVKITALDLIIIIFAKILTPAWKFPK